MDVSLAVRSPASLARGTRRLPLVRVTAAEAVELVATPVASFYEPDDQPMLPGPAASAEPVFRFEPPAAIVSARRAVGAYAASTAEHTLLAII